MNHFVKIKLLKKKGEIAWEELAKWVLIILVIIIVLVAITKLTGKSNSIWEKIKELLRFGT